MNKLKAVVMPTMINPEAIVDLTELRKALHAANATIMRQSSYLAQAFDGLNNQHEAITVLVNAHEAGDIDSVTMELSRIANRYRNAIAEVDRVKQTGRWERSAPVKEPASAMLQLDTDRLNHLAQKDHCILGFVNGVDASAGTIEEMKMIFENLDGSPPEQALRAALDLSMLVDRRANFGNMH